MNVVTRRLPRKRRPLKMNSSTEPEQTKTVPEKATAKARGAKRPATATSAKRKPAHRPPSAKKAAPARPGSKTAKILDLLKRPGGVTLKELIKATGWQAHSVRGFLSGTLGKKMGTPVKSSKRADGERTYRLSK
jgi:hypothetical protein